MQVVWFRQDLRVFDNPALVDAAMSGAVLPIYILDDDGAGEYRMGGASRVWLHSALDDLAISLDGRLQLFKGRAQDVLKSICHEHDVKAVHWNRCYEPWRVERDTQVKTMLQNLGVDAESHNGSLLWEPWQIKKSDGTPYRVFTPYYRKGCLNAEPPRKPLAAPQNITFSDVSVDGAVSLTDLDLLPDIEWHKGIIDAWDMTEKGAQDTLRTFMDDGGIDDYKEGRNFPAKSHVSRLSPYLHFGQISPHQIWVECQNREPDNNIGHFQSELGWREFSNSLLYQFPELPIDNLQRKFDAFPWREDMDALNAWQRGETGIPIVDAGMRELWQTGYMHNRVRMIVGSFLVKNLLLDWRLGEEWFWDCLVDADLANNSASWQWIAGCGADAAPYFRIFNPVTQGEKFDPDGVYTRRYVPELKNMPDKFLFKPWEAPEMILQGANIKLGRDYPKPIVDLKASRERALEAFKSL